jgi:hypothetical protein
MRTIRESGLSYDDMFRLMWLKYQVRSGKRSDTPIVEKPLRFAKHLYERVVING